MPQQPSRAAAALEARERESLQPDLREHAAAAAAAGTLGACVWWRFFVGFGNETMHVGTFERIA